MTDSISSLLESWQHEKGSAYLYAELASRAKKPVQQALFLQLQYEAKEQAALWADQLKAQGAWPRSYHPNVRLRFIRLLIIILGPETMRLILSATKVRGMSIYNSDSSHPMPMDISEVGSSHRSFGAVNNLRAAVFGINDGLISNTCLIMGMLGGHVTHQILLLTGIAGLLAGAFSMAAGEFVSVRAQREMLEYQIQQEEKELALYPQEEAAELSLIYQARGLSKVDADKAATTLIANPELALKTLAKEELGLDPDRLVSPYGAAISSFIAFTIGALVPLLPVIFTSSDNLPIAYVIVLSCLTLFIIGMLVSLFTGFNSLKNGLRMLLIGGAAGASTYVIGSLFKFL